MFLSIRRNFVWLAITTISLIYADEHDKMVPTPKESNSFPVISIEELGTWPYGDNDADLIKSTTRNSTDIDEPDVANIEGEKSQEINVTETEEPTNFEEESLNTTRDQIEITPDVVNGNFSVIEKMSLIGLVPYIVPKPPRTVANITFTCLRARFHVHANEGDAFSDCILKNAPSVEYECNDTSLYTLFMTYINMTDKNNSHNFNPERMIGANQYHNWLVYNIPGCNIKKGNELFKYEGPKPMDRNEYRIYAFFVFKQNQKFEVDLEERTWLYFFRDRKFHNEHRKHFTISEFIDKYDLGDLEAGSYIRQFLPSS